MLKIAERLFSGILSMTMLLFSGFEGNSPGFSDVFVNHDLESIRIGAVLLNGFDNDFEQIFRSGKTIQIFYQLDVMNEGEKIETLTFVNQITFDPINRFFTTSIETSNMPSYTTSCEDLRLMLSHIELYYNYEGRYGDYRFNLKAYMETIRLDSVDREFDLMMLWNFRAPSVSFNYRIVPYEI